MVTEATRVLNMLSSFGGWLSEQQPYPESISEENFMLFLEDISKEYELALNLHTNDMGRMELDIADYFNKVTSKKNALLAEEGAEVAADLVAATAGIVSIITSEIPFVNLAVSGTMITATATASVLELVTENLEKSVVKDIAEADIKLREYESFKGVREFQAVVERNSMFYPRLGFGNEHTLIRSCLMGALIYVKNVKSQQKNTGEPDVRLAMTIDEDRAIGELHDINKSVLDNNDVNILKQLLCHIYLEVNDNTIGEKVLKLYSGLGLTESQRGVVKKVVVQPREGGELIDVGVKTAGAILNIIAATNVIKNGMAWKKAGYVLGRVKVLENAPAELQMMLEQGGDDIIWKVEGSMETETIARQGANAAAKGISKMEILGKAIVGLAVVVNVVMAGLEIVKAVDTEVRLTKAIADSQSGITDYYRKLIGEQKEVPS